MATISKPKTEVQEYVLKEDRELPASDQTKWKLKGLSVADQTEVTNLGTSDENKRVSALTFAAKRGIVGWSNLIGAEEFVGNKLPEKDGLKRISADELEAVFAGHFDWLIEIGAEVVRISGLSDAEKN